MFLNNKIKYYKIKYNKVKQYKKKMRYLNTNVIPAKQYNGHSNFKFKYGNIYFFIS